MEEKAEKIRQFIREKVREAGVEKAVVGLSGGIDSAVTAKLAAEALGPGNVVALIMPGKPSRKKNVEDATELAEELDIEHRVTSIEEAAEKFTELVPYEVEEYDLGNIRARTRMVLLYLEAAEKNALVLGTGNRSELLLGYFTKHGDGAADISPIGDLYKTEVRELARHLEIPEKFVEKEPTAGLWEGQTDEDELGASYEVIDAVLRKLVDERKTVEETSEELDISPEIVERFHDMYEGSIHKRSRLETPGI